MRHTQYARSIVLARIKERRVAQLFRMADTKILLYQK